MRKFSLITAALLLACAPAAAIPPAWQPFAIGQQTFAAGSLDAAAQSLTIPAGGAVEAFIVCESQNVRWRDDGVAPTASVGTLLLPSQPFPYIANLPRLQLIAASAGASCTVNYYK